jgi:bifunctional DNA-binding transcriptional regulator/antitoxin component of YhaV-PrlF toxin-antitoxin module
MRKPVEIAAHGNSCRITFPQPTLKYLGWTQGTQLMMVVKDKHRVEFVELEQYFRELHEQQRRERQPSAEAASL